MPDSESMFYDKFADKWAYDWQALENVLAPGRIETQGRFLLHRSLNTRRLVGFLGSGVSMAYGRVSWDELSSLHIRRIIEFSEKMEREPPLDMLVNQIRKLEKPSSTGTSRNTIALHLCEQFWSLLGEKDLTALAETFDLEPARYRAIQPAHQPECGRFLFRETIKWETYDERGHVLRILVGDLQDGQRDWREHYRKSFFVTDDEARRPLDRLRFAPRSQPYLAFFDTKNLQMFRTEIAAISKNKSSKSNKIIEFSFEIFKIISRIEYRKNLAPTHYFSLGLALDLIRAAGYQRFVTDNLTKLSDDFKKTRPKISRQDVIPESQDPLRRLVIDLEIDRFATTNYDLEIERLFFELGFDAAQSGPNAMEHDNAERAGPLGGLSRDMILDGATAVDLVDFALDDKYYKLQVAHLHGRATTDSSIVVTDRDYQDTYIRDTKHAAAYRQGLEITFGGNPILFLGVGLSEGDLMRPLREFLTHSSARNRSLIAMRPALDSKTKREFFQVETYLRYGTHVIHYGIAESDDGTGHEDWLHLLSVAIAGMKEKLLDPKEPTEPKKPPRRKTRETAEAILKKAGGKERFRSDGGFCDIEFEQKLLEIIAKIIDQSSARTLERLTPSLRHALERAETAIVTAATNAALEGLHKNWMKWWQEWRRRPADRMDRLVYVRQALGDKSDGGEPSPCWVRHFLAPSHTRTGRAADFRKAAEAAVGSSRGRIFVIVGARGIGKGNLFAELIGASDRLNPDHATTPYKGRYFASFSFSCEIASVWDTLILFILKAGMPENISCQDIAENCDAELRTILPNATARSFTALSRIDRLKLALKVHADRPKTERLQIFLNAFDLLFHPDGMPKNLEIRQICDLLLGPEAAGCAIDLIVSVRDTRLPLYFRRPDDRALGKKGAKPRYSKDLHRVQTQLLMPVPEPNLAAATAMRDMLDECRANTIVTGPLTLLRTVPQAPPSRRGAFLYVPPQPSVQDILEARGDHSLWSTIVTALAADKSRSAQEAAEDIEAFFRHDLQARSFDASMIGRILEETVRRHGAQAATLSDRLREILHGVPHAVAASEGGAASNILDFVLDHWSHWVRDEEPEVLIAQLCEGRSALDGDLKALKENGATIADAATDFRLREALLRHLAVVAMPVNGEVLGFCPRIERLIDILAPGEPPNPAEKSKDIETRRRNIRSAIVRLSLAFLTDRCGLAFELEPDSDYPRYQIHRSLQFYIYRRLGSQKQEPSDGFFFTPSLYTTQTRDVPQLSSGAYTFLYELVDRLIDYPTRRHGRPLPDAWRPTCLRAALGVVRALFSVGIVSRFADTPALPVPLPPDMGYLEHHRLVIRWMLNVAVELDNADRSQPQDPVVAEAQTAEATNESTPILGRSPFYRDEIVWLYNEAGLFSLAQGRCEDAAPLFRQSLRINRQIEGRPGGAMHRRVELNDALCSVDRGRLAEARRRFVAVRDTEEEELLIREQARGFIGLVDHLGGRLNAADQAYQSALTQLVALGRLRSVSYFRKQRSDLLRRLGQRDKAREELDLSIQAAEAGGYIDFVHFAHVSDARLHLADGDARSLLPQLERADAYADMMDMPRLKGEVLRTRAEILLAQDETTLAADLVSWALRIANLNGLVLRRIAYSELLSKIYRKQGNVVAADRLMQWTSRSARDIGYALSLHRLEGNRDLAR